jgi:chromosomal replication initiation ATPase DnaA
MTANYYIILGITTAPITRDSIEHPVVHSSYRKREVVFARHLIMYFCRIKTNLTLQEIGLNFGFDHTTTLHGCRKIAGFLDIKDFVTCKAVEEIEMLIR